MRGEVARAGYRRRELLNRRGFGESPDTDFGDSILKEREKLVDLD